jgi:hypothetical protein
MHENTNYFMTTKTLTKSPTISHNYPLAICQEKKAIAIQQNLQSHSPKHQKRNLVYRQFPEAVRSHQFISL